MLYTATFRLIRNATASRMAESYQADAMSVGFGAHSRSERILS